MALLSAGFPPLRRLFRAAAPALRTFSAHPASERPVPPSPAPDPTTPETLSRKERVRRAFAEIPLTPPPERQALAALLEAGQGATAAELSQRCGWMPGA